MVVTGASSGIGRATALAASRRGDTVVLAARNEADLRTTAHLCGTDRGAVDVVVTDINDDTAVSRLIDDAARRFGRVDAVVHAAAVLAFGAFEDVPAAEFEAVIETNLGGTARVARVALGQFRRQGHGHLVLLGSLLGDAHAPCMSAYVASKWAVHGLARALQVELRGTPVNVSLVAPAGIRTPIYRVAANHVGRRGRPPPPVYKADIAAATILRVLDRPRRKKRVGGAVNLLASTSSRLAPRLYDRVIEVYIRFGALSRSPERETSGNLFDTLGHD